MCIRDRWDTWAFPFDHMAPQAMVHENSLKSEVGRVAVVPGCQKHSDFLMIFRTFCG